MRMRKVKLGEIRCSPVKDHHLHSLAQIQEPSWIQPPGLPWLVKSLLYPPRKLFCSDSSHHDGACQSTLMAMLKGKGVRDVSLTCIYSDTQAGLWSLQHWEHDDSTEGMCPGEKGGLQTEGGRPQVQNLPTLSKKDVTTGGKVFSRPSPRHHSHSKYTRCYCFPALDLLFLRVLLSGIRYQENVASILIVRPQITPCFLKTSLPKYDTSQKPHQILLFLFFCAPKYSSSEILYGFGSFIKDVKFDVIRDVKIWL